MADHPPKSGKAQTPVIPGAKELPNLTAKQMGFVAAILGGKNASDAYREAYAAADMAPATINAAASKLRRDPDIDAWIRAGHIAHLTSGVLTKEEHIRELGAIRELGKEQGDLKSAVAAEHLRGKASGFYVERSEVTIYDPAAILAQIATMDPQVAALLAQRFNLPLPSRSPASLASSSAASPIDGDADPAELAEISPSVPPAEQPE